MDRAHGSKNIKDADPGGGCYEWIKCEETKRAAFAVTKICDSYVMLAQAESLPTPTDHFPTVQL